MTFRLGTGKPLTFFYSVQSFFITEAKSPQVLFLTIVYKKKSHVPAVHCVQKEVPCPLLSIMCNYLTGGQWPPQETPARGKKHVRARSAL
jgi:hypothetical protein